MMMTKEVMAICLEGRPPHRNFMFQPVEYEDYIAIRVFQDNFATFCSQDREDLAVWIGALITKIRKTGVPCYIEVFDERGGKRI